jgi:hypothetical protein
MRRVTSSIVGAVLVLAPVVAAGSAGAAPAEAFCKMNAAGTTSDGTRFRAVGKVTKGEFTGRVKLRTAAGDRFRSTISILQCRRDGGGGPGAPAADVNIADIEGFGSWNGGPPVEWVGSMHDHGEGNLTDRLADDFRIAIELVPSTAFGFGGLLVAGNVQVHPPNGPHP